MKRAVGFRANEHVQRLPADVEARHPASSKAARAGLAAGAGEAPALTLDDLSFVETHDCFTIAELIEYEAMGLPHGRRGRARIALEG